MMTQEDLKQLLAQLIKQWESEIVEFKAGGNDFNTHDIGKYFSALSNEANLRNLDCAWLVFGICNTTKGIIGTNYRLNHDRLQSLKLQITDDTEPAITFRNIFEVSVENKRVIMFEVPPAPLGLPISWKGHFYARAGESLTALGLDKQDEIRRQTIGMDWTAKVVPNAKIKDLDIEALENAKKAFQQKHSNQFSHETVQSWSDELFLDRARLSFKSQITRTTLLLLGKPESAHFLNPNPAQITWKLEGPERAYEHFTIPFLLTSSQIFMRVRNYQVHFLLGDSLVSIQVPKYDRKITMEALHNCIAHQDYTRNSRIIVTEYPDRLLFENEGSFVDGSPEEYAMGSKTPRRYRNPFLTQAMVELNMIDTMGYGIHSMNVGQARRYFLLPDYDLSELNAVKLTLYGAFLDPVFSNLLYKNKDLPLEKIIQLDKESKEKTRKQIQETREETREEDQKTKVETIVKTKVKTKVKLLELMTQKPDITREELAKNLDLTISGIDWNIRQLKKSGKIKRIGSDKDGHWEVIDQ